MNTNRKMEVIWGRQEVNEQNKGGGGTINRGGDVFSPGLNRTTNKQHPGEKQHNQVTSGIRGKGGGERTQLSWGGKNGKSGLRGGRRMEPNVFRASVSPTLHQLGKEGGFLKGGGNQAPSPTIPGEGGGSRWRSIMLHPNLAFMMLRATGKRG